ncbi:ATP-binding cassette domain-containing protein [Treponema brennaborense]|uniref:ABC transporter related protein n=1 Tax=Treponema brennaborense (strain DSM 12168 / CIP 105900 / DD5/3) TaxID=906968 RepID=F4LP29_TREBD|nr:ATP-binding cassette domain-containing protein [Treponema brennaborense]AEE15905.1 ABC transporter related protein [Treponema brennaborense DSM 12168]
MNLLSVKELAKMGREQPLFTGVTFGLDEGEKAALIGKNGCGKSTLLNCIAGKLAPDDGSVVTAKNCGVSFLPQNPQFNADDTIREHIFKSESSKLAVIREYEQSCGALSDAAGLTAAQRLRFDALTEQMTDRDLWNYETHVKQVLSTLGITELDRTMGTLSGGMVKKVALAQVLIDDTKLLLLDEPTNHLDISAIAWLEEYLRTTNRAVLMVTHDRYFLDNVCSSIYELARARLKLYSGNYSQYLEKKETEAQIEANTERRIESVLRTEREWLLRGPQARGTKARARVDAIHRLINREKFAQDKGFTFETTGRRLGGKILELDQVSKTWRSADGTPRTVVSDFSYVFKKGEKLGIFGENGAGKTTLLNILTGTIAPDTGTVTKGENTVFAYYLQNPVLADPAPESDAPTVLEYILETAEVITMNNGKTLSAAKMLELFGFEGKIQYSPVTALSGGERKRLYLVRLLMMNPNFLVLDEPTNDFDIFTMSALESFLETYSGCLVVVSHDRCFMDKTADTLLILDGSGGVSGFVGSCSEYIAHRKETERSAQEKEKRTKAEQTAAKTENNASAAQNADGTPRAVKRRTYKEQREFEALEADIMSAEERKKTLEALLSGGETDYGKMGDLSAEYRELTAALEAKYARWEELGILGEN